MNSLNTVPGMQDEVAAMSKAMNHYVDFSYNNASFKAKHGDPALSSD
ncbi:hypothetical protein OK016_25920 [Vibrio chagasii]|nr:hypothetical protein [Vibrio chagasii]